MSWGRVFACVVFAGVLAWTFTFSKATDAEALTRAGKRAAEKIRAALPDADRLAGPLAAFRAGDALPVEERVRVRIHTDKQMAGTRVAVRPTGTAGAVKLSGLVATGGQRKRAVELAEGTAGVETVVDELAVPEGK